MSQINISETNVCIRTLYC